MVVCGQEEEVSAGWWRFLVNQKPTSTNTP